MVSQLGGFFARSNNLVLLPHIDTKEKFLSRSGAVIAFRKMFRTYPCKRAIATSFQANKNPGVHGHLRPWPLFLALFTNRESQPLWLHCTICDNFK
jgi:hypothetical protein